jgi:hypothetical protein
MLLTQLWSSDKEDKMSARWRKKTCCGGTPPTGVYGVAYLLVGEESLVDEKLEWKKMVARNLEVTRSGADKWCELATGDLMSPAKFSRMHVSACHLSIARARYDISPNERVERLSY